MKKLLLTSIAALFLATGTAHADATLSPTHPLIGNWCETEGSTLLKRGPECDTAITKNGYGGVDSDCTFLEIKPIRNGIEASSRCSMDTTDRALYYEHVRVQIVGKRLKFETLTDYTFKATQIETGDTHRSMCVAVQPTPDGYLNVRQGPGMNFKPIAKLVPGQRISVDVQTDEWTHLTRICDEKEDLDGWVYNKYVKDIDGSDIKRKSGE